MFRSAPSKAASTLCRFLLLLVVAACATLARGEVVISEFLAVNADSLTDEDGESSDWIELYNAGGDAVNLEGWYLTDDDRNPTKWRLPAVTIESGAFLIIFASGKDRLGPELHANFRLSGNGEYLGLIRPDGRTVAYEYAPGYPRQREGISYGLFTAVTTLLAEDAALQVHVPADDVLGTAWTQPEFMPDDDWTPGPGPAGYYAGSGGGVPVHLRNYWALAGDLRDTAAAHHGIFRGGNPTYVAGPGGSPLGALSFDGTDDYVDVSAGGARPPIYNEPAFSVTLWVKGLPQRDKRVYSEGWSVTTRPVFVIGTENSGTTGQVDVYIRTKDGAVLISHALSTGTAFDGTWHHLAWVDDGGEATLYIDGEGDPTNFSYPKVPLDLNRTAIGAILRDGPTYHFQGSIAQVGVWDRLLAPDEVIQLARGAVPQDIGGFAYTSLIDLDLGEAMFGVNATAYLRAPFTVSDLAGFESLLLGMRYDDGFVAYLNGVEVARRNAPAVLSWQAAAPEERLADEVFREELIAISEHREEMRPGENVVAIHGLNVRAGDAEFLVTARLLACGAFGDQLRYFPAPTPGGPNTEGGVGIVADTSFSHDRGFYAEAFPLEITTETEEAEIRYTLDGSEPTQETGLLYTGPIEISTTTMVRAAAYKADLLPTNVDTHTYVFPADVIRQQRPAGFPTDWGGIAAKYDMDQAIVEDPAFRNEILGALGFLPILSIVMDYEHLFGPDGIYRNPTRVGMAGERPASIELFHAEGGGGFQISGGVRISGNVSRTQSPKHGIRMVFKGRYGPRKLKYRVFPDSPVDRFDTLIARPNAFDSWVSNRGGGVRNATYLRDPFVRETHVDTKQVAAHGFYVHLYLNGLYWGLFSLVERPDASFGASYLGGEKENYDAIKNHEEVTDGTIQAYNELDAIRAAGVASPTDYALIQTYVDVENLADYMIVNMFAPATDWPGNYKMVRERAPGAQFKFFCWDSEYAFLEGLTVNRTLPHWRDDDSPTKFYHALRENAEFRVMFADRLHKHFFNNGIVTPQAAMERWQTLADEIEIALICESARWGDYVQTPACRPDVQWRQVVDSYLTDFLPQRSAVVLGQFRQQGMYPAVEAPEFNQHGGTVSSDFVLVVTASAGSIYYTLDSDDPRLPDGVVSPEATVLADPPGNTIALGRSMHVMARAKLGATWSALTEADFHVPTPLDWLRITEIMYNPPDEGPIDGDEFEFIELKNTGSDAIDLTDVSLGGGVSFVFPEGALLLPGEFAVLGVNAAALGERYPGVLLYGTYGMNLSNAGDAIEVRGPDGRLLTAVSYDDAGPWPVDADGWGYSLVPVDPLARGDQNDPAAWRGSAELGGSPGADDGAWQPVAPVIAIEPADQTVRVGERAVFAVTVHAHPIPNFRWQRDGLDIPQATSRTYRTGTTTLADDGAVFRCLMWNSEGSAASRLATMRVLPSTQLLRRGDANIDGSIDISDAIYMLSILFAGAENLCDDARDANDDGSADIADPIAILSYLFANGPPPPPPFPNCGVDMTPDELMCETYGACP